ncbi:MAG: thioredoxin [Gemmatimonas sp. SG8_38_2]|nr:MAG: thioredoxin [Gemmatimonas sp. SG8_38_2]
MAGTDLLVEVTDDTFAEEIEQHEGLALIDLWATWCGPCQMIAPVVAQLAEEYQGKLKVAKLDVDNNMRTPTQYGVQSIPTLLLFKDGSLVDKVVGAVPKQHVVEKIEQHLG